MTTRDIDENIYYHDKHYIDNKNYNETSNRKHEYYTTFCEYPKQGYVIEEIILDEIKH